LKKEILDDLVLDEIVISGAGCPAECHSWISIWLDSDTETMTAARGTTPQRCWCCELVIFVSKQYTTRYYYRNTKSKKSLSARSVRSVRCFLCRGYIYHDGQKRWCSATGKVTA